MRTKFIAALLVVCAFGLPAWANAQSPPTPDPAPGAVQVHLLPACPSWMLRGISGPAYVVGLNSKGQVVCTSVVPAHHKHRRHR